jgi:hypothetical protein
MGTFLKLFEWASDHIGAIIAFCIILLSTKKETFGRTIINLIMISAATTMGGSLIADYFNWKSTALLSLSQFVVVFGTWLISSLIQCLIVEKCRDVVFKIVGKFIPFFMPPQPPPQPTYPQQPVDYARNTEDADAQRKIDDAVAKALAAYIDQQNKIKEGKL